MERIVIACYKPKAGKERALDALMETHVAILQREGLATDRAPVAMKAVDGTVIEVFGWKSKEAIEQAHTHPVVLKMWEEFAAVCEYISPASIPELNQLFADFEPMN